MTVKPTLMLIAIGLICLAASPAEAWSHHRKAGKHKAEPVQICQLRRVIDGDTAVFICPGWRKPESTRLIGFNAPDMCQPRFHEAKAWLQQTLAQGEIALSTKGRDTYQRVLAKVYVHGQLVTPPAHLTAHRKHCATHVHRY